MLKLEPERVKEKQDAYTSLTDLYGVEVFTDEFLEALQEERQKEMAADDKVAGSVFINEEIGEAVQTDDITQTLFTQKTSQVLIKEAGKGNTDIPLFQAAMVMISMLAVIMLYRIFGIKKQGGKKSGDKIDLGFPGQKIGYTGK